MDMGNKYTNNHAINTNNTNVFGNQNGKMFY